MVGPHEDTFHRGFFEGPSDTVAEHLVGALMIVRTDSLVVRVRVVETEAYGGLDDPASHAFRGPTPRAAIMFGPAGILYVYRSYGVHWCMNVVTGPLGTGSAVLLRAGEVVGDRGEPLDPRRLLRGPGNLTRGLGVTGADNGADCCQGPDGRFSFRAGGVERGGAVARSERVGISRARERLSRYFLTGHPAVSAPRHPRPASPT